MPRKLDPRVSEILKSHGFGPEACWDCHGTWVVYHHILEQIAVKTGINFEAPLPLETNGAAKSVAICVTGRINGRAEWSIGEAAPGNNKNGYPYAMAEKRAKDRVILKFIGLHGLVYSEEEMSERQNGGGGADATDPKAMFILVCKWIIANTNPASDLEAWWRGNTKNLRLFELTQDEVDELKGLIVARLKPSDVLKAG